MPNLVILISNILPQEGTLRLAFISWTSAGLEAGGDILMDFDLNASQITTALIDAAKTLQTSQNGVVFLPADKIKVFSGPSNTPPKFAVAIQIFMYLVQGICE